MTNELNCVVAAKARQLGETVRAWDNLGKLIVRERGDRSRYQRQRDILYDVVASLEGEVTLARTTSAVGAISQLMMAFSEIKCHHETTENCRLPDETMRRIERCLYSAVGYLETVMGESAEDLGSFYYMPKEFDPFEQVEAGFRAAWTVDEGEG